MAEPRWRQPRVICPGCSKEMAAYQGGQKNDGTGLRVRRHYIRGKICRGFFEVIDLSDSLPWKN